MYKAFYLVLSENSSMSNMMIRENSGCSKPW